MKHYDDIAADDYYDMGLEWFRAGNFEKAVENLKKAIDLNEHFTYAYITLAEVQAATENYSEAFHTIKRASKMDPTFDRLNYLCARYAYKSGNFPAALRSIEKAVELNPSRLHTRSRDLIRQRIEHEMKRE